VRPAPCSVDLLVFRDEDGAWRDVRSEEVNAYLREKAGEAFSAKDFRTWHGTVLAAVELAREGAPGSKGGGERAIRAAVKRVAERLVAERLGNTPAVCRSSYIDPRVLDRFRDGKTIEIPSPAPETTVTPRQQSAIERRVLTLIE
jgi:DNA topoisomerase IB